MQKIGGKNISEIKSRGFPKSNDSSLKEYLYISKKNNRKYSFTSFKSISMNYSREIQSNDDIKLNNQYKNYSFDDNDLFLSKLYDSFQEKNKINFQVDMSTISNSNL